MNAERETGCLLECRHLLSCRRDRIAARWYAAIAHQTFSPFAESEILTHLSALIEQAIGVLTDALFAADAAEEIGATLIHLRYLDPGTLRQTISVLGEELGKDIPATLSEMLHERLPALLGAVAAGHEAAARVLVLDEQEGIRAALLAERERITAVLRESEARFRSVFVNAVIGITLADLEGRAIECNPATERILGYRQAELRQLAFTDITHLDDIAEDRALFKQLVAGKRGSYHKEKRYQHKHGEIVVCNLTASLLRDAEGTPRFVLGMIEDITERKRLNPTAVAMRQRITEREMHVFALLAQGLTQEQVANEEHLSPRTVGRMVAVLQEKLGVSSLFALGMHAVQLELIQ